MKERDVRQRIESFLKRTARDVVVPASMGIGLALSGCERTALNSTVDAAFSRSAKPDAGLADAALGAASPDAGQPDLAMATHPYTAVRMQDAAMSSVLPDVGGDVGAPDASVDLAASDLGRDMRQADSPVSVRPDAAQDLPTIQPPYMLPYLAPAFGQSALPVDAAAAAPDAPSPPPPPYLGPPFR